MEYLMDHWDNITRRLDQSPQILAMFDYDGTLTPIVDNPELARISEVNKLILAALARKPDFTVGIISGRSLSDLKEKVKFKGIIRAGNHGLEIDGPGFNYIHPVAIDFKPVVKLLGGVLSHAMQSVRGARVENKELGLSLHYRQVENEDSGKVKEVFHEVLAGAETTGKIKVTEGKKVYEIRPAISWDKGKAVKYLMKRYGKGGRISGLLPIYCGDDVTDEDAFEVIQRYENGVSVYIGEPEHESRAQFYLRSTMELTTFLSELLEYAGKRLRSEQVSRLSSSIFGHFLS